MLGSKQLDAFKSHYHRLKTEAGTGFGEMVFADYGSAKSPWVEVASYAINDQVAPGYLASTFNEGGSETRAKNTAMHPVVCL